MKTFTVLLKTSDGRTITVDGVRAKDAWQARTMVWLTKKDGDLAIPSGWTLLGDGVPEINYVVTEVR